MKIRISKEDLERMYVEKKLGYGQISFAKGMSSKTIKEHLKFYNIPIRDKKKMWRDGKI